MSTEQSYSYDGPLSTYREWDSLIYGLTAGVILQATRIAEDIANEPSKFLAGVFIGYAIKRQRGD